MFLGSLFTILIVIISLLDVASVVIYRRADQQLCYGNYGTWLCSKNEKCGNTYNSCIHNSNSNERSSVDSTVKGIIGILTWFGLCFCIPCYRSYRRKQAAKQLIRQVQTAITQNVQQRSVYIIVNSSVANTSLINEEPPPAYEQIAK